MVMAFSWILAGDEILNILRDNDQGLSIQDLSTITPSPSNTPSPSATRTKAAFTSAAMLIDTPTPAASATRTEAIFTQKSTFTPNCTFTIHFWRVYTEVWRIEIFDLDSRSYSKEQAIAILNIEDPNLVTTRLLQQYITALLNTMKGADPSGIERTIERVRDWLILHPPEIRLTQTENLEGERLADELQDYNDGVTGPGRCIEEPFTPTPGATPTPLNYTPPATATNTPGPLGTIFFPTETATKKPGGGKPKPTNTPPPPQPTNTPPPPPPSNTPQPTATKVPPTPAPTQPPPTP
jgi:hypothetical protein